MHLNDGEIRAFQDEELRPDRYPQVQAHLASCAQCQARADALSARSQQVNRQLAYLEDPRRGPVPATIGRSRLASRLEGSHKEKLPMMNKITSRRLRPLWVGLGLIAVIAIALSFPQVRAAAGSFLGLFRVQQIAIVQFDPQALQDLENADQFETILSDDAQFEEIGQFQEVTSPEEAGAIAGFRVRLPAGTPQSGQLEVMPGGRAVFNVDLARIQLMLEAIDRQDIQLPQELDGSQVTVEIPMGVTAYFGDCKTEEVAHVEGEDPDAAQPAPWEPPQCTTLIQIPSPTVSAPEGLNMAQIGQAYLQLFGLSAEEVAQLTGSVDWTTTFVIPIPRGEMVTTPVSVDGVQATLVQDAYAYPYRPYLILWVKDGILYAISGFGDSNEAVKLADSLQ